MKKIAMMAIAALFALQVLAAQEQEETAVNSETKSDAPATLFSDYDFSFSGYGAPVVRMGKAGEKLGTYLGMKGGVIINDSWVFGFSGFALAYPYKRDDLSGSSYSGEYPNTAFGYGGFMMEYVFTPKSLVNFSVGTTIGGGGLNFYESDDDYEDDEDAEHSSSDSFFAVEPEVNVFINLTRFCKVGVGVSYRYIYGIDTAGFNDKDFRGVNGSFQVSFGWF